MAASAPSSQSQMEKPALSSCTCQSRSGPSGQSLQQLCLHLSLLWCAANHSERSLQQCAHVNCNYMKWHALVTAACNGMCLPIAIVLRSWCQHNQRATCTCKLWSHEMANFSGNSLQWPVCVNHDFCEWLIPVKTALGAVREQATKEEKQWIGDRIVTNLLLGKQAAGNNIT